MRRKKRVCLIFPDEHLPFSPTTLNLKNALSSDFKVTIIAFYPFFSAPLIDPDVKYFKKKMLLFKIFNKILHHILGISKYSDRYLIWQKLHVITYLLFKKHEHLIVVDLKSLWFVKDVRKKNIHLLSLELTRNTIDYKDKVNIDQVSSIIIQSEERLDFLIGHSFKGKVFYIQNAPNFDPDIRYFARDPNKLIYTGTAIKEFGILHCLKFLDEFPQYQLNIQGAVPVAEAEIIAESYTHLIPQNRLVISSSYLNSSELIKHVSQFRIGFCFYDFSYDEINNFNYRSAPSGKMFTYFAAGVPVIGINIPGLNPISDFKAGVQISNLNSGEILNAIKQIESDYESYSSNCFKAAEHFDFYQNSNRFINYLKAI